MKAIMTAALAGGFAAGLACGGDGSGPSRSELAGTWQLTKCEYVSTQGLGSVDLIAGGGSGTVTITADTIRITVTPAGGAPETFAGTYEIDGIDLMRVTPLGASWYWAFDMNFSGNHLTLRNGSAEYDINQDGTPDPAKWNMEMTR